MNVTPFPGSEGSGIGPALRAAKRRKTYGTALWRDLATPQGWKPASAGTGGSVKSPTLALARAVAGIVAVAAERARAAGEFGLLRDEVLKVLDQHTDGSSPDPRDTEAPEQPPITDADPQTEVERLASLLQRQVDR
jgi:hypothetical protein